MKLETDLSQNQDVVKFFEDLSLPKYAAIFVENGIEDLETISQLQEDHLEMMKIPLGHKLKIMKKIREI